MKYILFILFLIFTYQLSAQINADFSADQLTGCEVANVSFEDLSTSSQGPIISWEWQIGSVMSELQNPGAILNQVGEYTVCLTVTDASNNTATICKEDYISIFPNPVANFSFLQNSDCSPSEVVFLDESESTYPITSWIWGIGGSSNVINTQDPDLSISTVYSNSGSYSVSVIVEDENGCTDIETKNNLINVKQSPDPQFSAVISESCSLPISVSFVNQNVETGTSYFWDFGNGNTFDGADPTEILFDQDGIYEISLTAIIDDCMSESLQEINIITDPQLSFSTPSVTCVNNEFVILNTGSVPIDSVFWETDTGLEFRGEEKTKIFLDEPGCYEFSAQVYINGCVYEYVLPDCIEIEAIPELNFDFDYKDACQVPFTVDFVVDLEEGSNVKWEIETPFGFVSLSGISQSFEFTEPGTYQVNFEYKVGGSCIHRIQLDSIEVRDFGIIEPPKLLGGCIPISFELAFDVHSVSPIVFQEWSIPDLGIISNDETLSVTINEPNSYNVYYVVENADGCRDSIFIEDYIAGGNMPVTDFDFGPLEQCASETFSFFDESSSFANEWYWLFSDSLDTEWTFGEDIYEAIKDTGWIDIYHTSAEFGCFGDTIHLVDAFYVLGPVAEFKVEEECNSLDVFVVNRSIAADSFYFEITEGLQTTVIEQDSFWYSFSDSGVHLIKIFTFNDSTGCEMVEEQEIFIPDFDLGFVAMNPKGCVPLTVEFAYLDDPLVEFATDHGVITDVSDGHATVRYDDAGAFPSPYLLRYRNDCIDTIFTDSIFVNKVVAKFNNNPVFCAPDDHPLNNTSTSLFGEINSALWVLNGGALISDSLNPVFYIEEDTVYSVHLTVEDTWGCKDTLLRNFAIKPRFLEADFTISDIACENQPVSFINNSTGIELLSYRWDFGDGTLSDEFSPMHAYDEEGLYDVCLIIEDNITCKDTICLEDFVEVRNPIANFTGDPLSIECPPLITDFINESQFANEYFWDFGDNSGPSLLEDPSHIYNQVGLFDVMLVATNNGECPDTLLLSEYIDVDGPVGEWEFDKNSKCLPLDVMFNGSSDGPYKYVWDFGNGDITAPTTDRFVDTVAYSYTSPGVFIPKLLLDNNAGCIISVDGDTIVVNDIDFNIDIGDSTFCVSPGIISIENNTTTSGEAIVFSWEFDNGQEFYNSNLPNPEFTILNSGEYKLSVFAETENCVDSLFFNGVQLIDGIGLSASNDTICYDTFSDINVDGDVNYFEWYTIGGEFVGSSDSLVLRLTESEDFYVVGFRESCPNDTAYAFVEVYDPVIIDLEQEYTVYANQFPQVDLSFDGDYAFSWSPPGGLSCLSCPQPIIMPDPTTRYFVEVTDLHSGCIIESSIRVNTNARCVDEGLHTPNIFSPNGDGTNDGVRVYTQRETDFISLTIFDRWGNRLFFSEDINESWDGWFKGQPAITGVYTMKINGICTDSGEPFTVYRDVSLVR